MTKQNFTSINVILDRSGSMASLASETISGFNKFLAEQKAVKEEAVLTLATFASDYTLIHDFVPLDSICDLTADNYKPAGYTSLLYAIGRTIDATGKRLAEMPEEQRPSKIICLIISDGRENHSHHIKNSFTREQILNKITHQQEKYNWEFVYLGASADQIQDSISIGIRKENTMKYDLTGAGVTTSYNTISGSLKSYRLGNTQRADFFDQDKK